VLTIAGSDSGGGAGIQADLKTFTALGCYGMSAITAVTVQNTLGVFGYNEIPAETVAGQITVVLDDIGADAVKTGMLASAAIIEAVVDALRGRELPNLVVDPVMVAKSGDPLLQENARTALIELLLPLATIVTPNIPEAEVLSERRIAGLDEVQEAARIIRAMGPRYVLMKGGHLAGNEATDYLWDGTTLHTFAAERIDTKNTHGTGCTYASAIAAYLAHGEAPVAAVQKAKAWLHGAIKHHVPMGHGHGPLNHLWKGAMGP
jgi:hydroxymethylpyrimidine/phosphomethylpyrimidine kinase